MFASILIPFAALLYREPFEADRDIEMNPTNINRRLLQLIEPGADSFR